MGCDIHTTIQGKTKDGKWKTLKLYAYNDKTDEYGATWSITDYRNYALFTKLAGVRGPASEALVDLRGWPNDITDDVREEYLEPNWCHSHTWFDFTELKALARTPEAIDYTYEEEGYNYVEDWVDRIEIILDAYGYFYPKPGEVRVLICFDN